MPSGTLHASRGAAGVRPPPVLESPDPICCTWQRLPRVLVPPQTERVSNCAQRTRRCYGSQYQPKLISSTLNGVPECIDSAGADSPTGSPDSFSTKHALGRCVTDLTMVAQRRHAQPVYEAHLRRRFVRAGPKLEDRRFPTESTPAD